MFICASMCAYTYDRVQGGGLNSPAGRFAPSFQLLCAPPQFAYTKVFVSYAYVNYLLCFFVRESVKLLNRI